LGIERRSDGDLPVRWLLSGIVAALAIVLLSVLALPLFVSDERMRERIADEIAAASGHRVTLGEDLEIGFLPVPTITVTGLTLSSYRSSGAEALLVAEKVQADFGLMSVLAGEPQFSNFRLTRPVATFEVFPDGTTSWTSRRGHIAESAAIAADNARARMDNAEDGETTRPMPMTPLGAVNVADGRLRIINRETGREATLSDIDGNLTWPRVGMGARLELTGEFRGEQVRVSAGAERPSDLLAGNVAPFRLDVTSDLLSLKYAGTAGFNGTPVLSGRLSLSSPSARRALQWSGTDIKPGEAIGALDLEASLQAGGPQIRLNDLVLEIDRNRGIGVLDINWPADSKPIISGTLAYDALDVGAFLGAFTPLPIEGADIAQPIDTGFLRQLGLDLRLSAQTARIGSITLQSLAAAARIEEGRALFDIGDAVAYGGNVLGRVAISEDGLRGGGELQISAQNVDFGSVYEAIGMTGPLPRGSGTMNLALRSPNPIWATTLQDLQGTIEMSIRDGRVPMIDLGRFRELSRNTRFFEIDQASGDGIPFRTAVLNATFADGTAEIKQGEIVTENAAIVLSGLVPYDRGSLAMSGAITAPPPPNDQAAPAPDAAPAGAPLRFFVGGSWPTPVISPIAQN
jgi:AsmA protein